MKVVKLNRRFDMYNKYGHQIGIRFPTWSLDAQRAERTVQQMLGSQYANNLSFDSWRGYFGKSSGHYKRRPYWLTFKNPVHVTMLLLKLDQKS